MRDVPGTLDQGTDGQPLAEQPVQSRDVGSQVAAHEDRTRTGGECVLEMFVSANFESLEKTGFASQRLSSE